MADGMAVAVECALETAAGITDWQIVLAAKVEVGSHLEEFTIVTVSAIHQSGQSVHIVRCGDDVGVGFSAASAAEQLRFGGETGHIGPIGTADFAYALNLGFVSCSSIETCDFY